MTTRSIRFGALLLRYFGVTVAAVMLALGGFSYVGVGWLAAELSDDLGERAAQLVQSRAFQYVDDAGSAVRIIGGFQQGEADSGRNLVQDHETLWRLLWSGLSDTKAVESLYAADIQGHYAEARRDPALATRLIERRAGDGKNAGRELFVRRDEAYRVIGEERDEGAFDARDAAWFRNTGAERNVYWSETFVSPSTKQAVIAVTYPITDRDGRVVRVVGAHLPLERLSRHLVQSRPTWSSIVLLVNGRGEILANAIGGSSRPLLVGDRIAKAGDLGVAGLADALKEIQLGTASSGAIKVGGQSYRARLKTIGSYDATAVVLIPDSDALVQLQNLLIIALLVIAAVLLVAVIALLRLSQALSRPLTRLADQAAYIRGFELDAFKGVHSRITEVAQLNSALESAVEALKGFKRYVPADLVRQLLTSPEFASVGGREAELAVMFTDIFGFTAIAERLSPKDLMSQISEYLELMTSVIMKHGGTVDKYIGDAVMAFWGAPQAVADGPAMACQAALECQRLLAELNGRWAGEGRPQLITGIGINVARVVVGNFGSSDRLNYSLLGDGVNLAARLEKLNREYGTRILISDATKEKLAEQFDTRLVGGVVMKGRTQPVQVFELLAGKTPV